MNRLRHYRQPLLTSLLVAVFLIVPQVAFAGVESFFQEILWGILITITGSILWICATIFDYAVNTFVIGFGNLYLGSGIGDAVDRIWFILRDFVNMFFIFGLVYIGFKMILDADNSNTRRWLVNLIIAAVLINFSLFITKAVVDFSNQIATQIAISGFPEGGLVDSKWGGEDGQPGKVWKVDLANYTISLMGIKDLMNCKAAGTTGACAGGWGYIFGTAIFFLITAFVLAAGAFMLLTRFVVLTFFLLVSPFMFISWILPPVSDTMNKYWKAFLARAFFAPVYFLFLYFSLETLNGLQRSLGMSDKGGAWATTFSAPVNGSTPIDSSATTLPFFFVICGFMIGSLMIAQKLGDKTADGAMGMLNSAKSKVISGSKKVAGAGTLGVAGAVGQRTVGRGAHALANSQWAQSRAAQGKFGGRTLLKATKGVADSSFDARRVDGLGKNLGIGEGTKGGFSTLVKERKEKDEKFMKSLDDTNMDDPENKRRAAEAAEDMAHDADGVLDSENKETADLTVELDDLGTEIDELTTTLQEQIKNQTITSREAYAAQRNIDLKTKRKGGMERVRDRKLSAEILEDKINQTGLDASLATDPKVKAELREMQQHLQAKLNREQLEGQRLTKEANSMFVTAADGNRTISQLATDTAKAEIKYENKRAFMKTAKKKASGKYATAGDKESLENLQKKFGKDANEMAKKSNEDKEAKKIAKQIAELQKNAGEVGDKKEEKKEGGDAH